MSAFPSRRGILVGAAGGLAWSIAPDRLLAQAGTLGVVLLHGKRASPGRALGAVSGGLERAGVVTISPEMPWSASRYLDGSWSDAMAEIDRAVQSVRARGATRIALAGHSIGCPAAMSYAASRPAIAALALTAPGHNPSGFYRVTPAVRESVDRARALMKAGRGAEVAEFVDNNQGNVFSVRTSAANYLSYFDPGGSCEMSVTAGRVRCPVLWVVGTGDRVIDWGAPVARRLTSRPRSRYLTVQGAGHGNTPSLAASEIAEWLTSV